MSRVIEEGVTTNAEVGENVGKQHLRGKHTGGRSQMITFKRDEPATEQGPSDESLQNNPQAIDRAG